MLRRQTYRPSRHLTVCLSSVCLFNLSIDRCRNTYIALYGVPRLSWFRHCITALCYVKGLYYVSRWNGNEYYMVCPYTTNSSCSLNRQGQIVSEYKFVLRVLEICSYVCNLQAFRYVTRTALYGWSRRRLRNKNTTRR